jgi:hypothetical protein
MCKLRNFKDFSQSPPAKEKLRRIFIFVPQEGTNPTNELISNFWPTHL